MSISLKPTAHLSWGNDWKIAATDSQYQSLYSIFFFQTFLGKIRCWKCCWYTSGVETRISLRSCVRRLCFDSCLFYAVICKEMSTCVQIVVNKYRVYRKVSKYSNCQLSYFLVEGKVETWKRVSMSMSRWWIPYTYSRWEMQRTIEAEYEKTGRGFVSAIHIRDRKTVPNSSFDGGFVTFPPHSSAKLSA